MHQDVDSFETELVERLADFIRYDWTQSSGPGPGLDGPARSNDSPGESRLAVIGTVSFEIEEVPPPQRSVSIDFPTVESVGDVIEMAEKKRGRFAIDDDDYDGFESGSDGGARAGLRDELGDLYQAQQSGTAFILGHSHVQAKHGSSVFKRVAINFGYNFLRRNCRGPDVALKVPPVSLLEVGMVYIV